MCLSGIITPKKFATASAIVRVRTYSVILCYSILLCSWGIMIAIWHGNSGVKLIGMGSVLAAIGVFVFGLILALIRFNHKPDSGHKLTRIRTHLYSLVFIACIVIAISIPLFTQIPNQCYHSHYLGDNNTSMGRGFYCTWLSVTILYSWICALMALLIAFVVRRRAIRSNFDMRTTNIALLR